MQYWLFSIMTLVFSVTWFFRNDSTVLCWFATQQTCLITISVETLLLLSFCFQCLIKCEIWGDFNLSLCFYVSGEERPDETDTLLEVEVEESNIFPDTLATETTPATVPRTITTTTTPSIATTTTRRTIYREERPAPTVTLELDNTSNNSYIAGTVDFKTILWSFVNIKENSLKIHMESIPSKIPVVMFSCEIGLYIYNERHLIEK